MYLQVLTKQILRIGQIATDLNDIATGEGAGGAEIRERGRGGGNEGLGWGREGQRGRVGEREAVRGREQADERGREGGRRYNGRDGGG
jgi:hypothetical protein